MTQPVTKRLCPKCDAPVTTGFGMSGAYVYCENPRCDFFEKASQPKGETNGQPTEPNSSRAKQ